MSTVITAEQARKIVGNRQPLLPAEYTEALKLLAECTTFDEAKYWSTKADIAAAWAKIYHSDEVMRRAKILKLHAYKRMSQLAEQMRPKTKPGPGGSGPKGALRELGIAKHEAEQIRAVGTASQQTFEAAVSAARPPTPRWFKNRGQVISGKTNSVMAFAQFCRRVEPEDVLDRQNFDDAKLAEAARVIGEWADRLEQLIKRKSR